jgi:hypothetical protein
MKRTFLISASVVCLTLLIASTGKSLRTEAESQAGGMEWEYLIVAGGSTNLSSAGNDQYPRMRKAPDGSFTREQFPLARNLDKLGAEGWELVAVQGTGPETVFYLKRPRHSGR